MLCAIYRSHKKAGAYLYLRHRDDFSQVPEALLARFGPPELLMMRRLQPDKPLANADVIKVIEELMKTGFYLQLSPPPEDLLKQNKQLLNRLRDE